MSKSVHNIQTLATIMLSATGEVSLLTTWIRGLPTWMPRHTAGSYWACSQYPKDFLQDYSLTTHLPVCICVWHYPVPGAVSRNYLCWISYHCWFSNTPLYVGLSNSSRVTELINRTFQFCIISKHARDATKLLHPKSLIEMLNRTGQRTEPCETLLVTGCQPDAASFTKNLWALEFSLFTTKCNMNLLNSSYPKRCYKGLLSKSRKVQLKVPFNH